jgi:hypothetical protein
MLIKMRLDARKKCDLMLVKTDKYIVASNFDKFAPNFQSFFPILLQIYL